MKTVLGRTKFYGPIKVTVMVREAMVDSGGSQHPCANRLVLPTTVVRDGPYGVRGYYTCDVCGISWSCGFHSGAVGLDPDLALA